MKLHDIVRMNERAKRCFKGHGYPIPILLGRKEGIVVVEAKCKGVDAAKPSQDGSSSLAIKKLDIVEAPDVVGYGWVSIHKSPKPRRQWVLERSLTEIKLDGCKYVLLTNGAKVPADEGAILQCLHILVFGQFLHDQFDDIEGNIQGRLQVSVMRHMKAEADLVTNCQTAIQRRAKGSPEEVVIVICS